MGIAPIRVLVVDDFEPFRRFLCSKLTERHDFEVVGECRDGFEAVREAEELQPDLILLDIGLPRLNGIGAARQIRACAPKSRILFVSENHSRAIADEAMHTGAAGYLVKSHVLTELFPAMSAVLRGEDFVGAGLDDQVPPLPTRERDL